MKTMIKYLHSDEVAPFFEKVREEMEKYPMLRYGQTVFNIAYTDGYETESVRGNPNIDPFHNDDNVGRFIEHISAPDGHED